MENSQKRLLFIYNPYAGLREIVEKLDFIFNYYASQNIRVEVHPTQGKGDAKVVVSRFAKEFDYIVCAGGDGTFNEVVDGIVSNHDLANLPDLGYIPCGSTNDFANSFGIPIEIEAAVKSVLEGSLSYVDIGRINNRYFTYVTGFGLFTDVSYGTPQPLKNIFGHAAYILEGAKRLGNVPKIRCTIEIDGEAMEEEVALCIITNSAKVGGFKLPEGLNQTDEFQMIYLRNANNLTDYTAATAMVLGLRELAEPFVVKSFQRLRFTFKEEIPWTIDGEYGGSFLESDIEIYKNRLELILPNK